MLRWFGLALVLAGCVSVARSPSPTDAHGRTTTTVPATTTTTVEAGEGLEAYRSCLEGEGVIVPDIPFDALGRPRFATAMRGLNLSDDGVLEALDACASHIVGGPLDLSGDPVLADLVVAGLTDFSECMRQHGVEGFPDPVSGYVGLGSPFNVRRIDWTDPALSGAADACSAQIGQSSP